MKLPIFFLLLIFTLNLEPNPVNIEEKPNPENIEEKPNPEKPEENQIPLEAEKKVKPKDLNFTRTDERFSEPFIGHLKVFDTSTFNLEINEYEEKQEEEELNKIVSNIKKLKFLGDEQKEEKEYEIEGKEIFGLEKKNYNDFLDKLLEMGEYNYENLYNPKNDIENELSSTWMKISLIYNKHPLHLHLLNSITLFQKISNGKIDIVFVILKNVAFKFKKDLTRPLIIFTSSKDEKNPIFEYKIKKPESSYHLCEKKTKYVVDYFDLNVYKFLSDQYRSKTDFSFLE